MPTVRIDSAVYEWLQQQARPFEDTPNSVLRRIAGLGDTQRSNSRTAARRREGREEESKKVRPVSGRKLNELWGVGAKHALYHRDGCWYNNLERFPGALFDPNGYVVFETEEAYRKCAYLRITQETNVPNGIKSIPGYVRVGG